MNLKMRFISDGKLSISEKTFIEEILENPHHDNETAEDTDKIKKLPGGSFYFI